MLKIFSRAALVAITLVLMSGPSLATTSRINSLGGNGDYFEDDANVGRWSGSLVDFPNQVFLESGNFNLSDGYWQYPDHKSSGPGFGVQWGLGAENRQGTVAFSYHDQGEDRNPFLVTNNLRENINLMYGRTFGPVSATLSYGHGAWKVQETESVVDHSANTYGAGARIDLGEKAYLDVAIDWRTTSNQAPPSNAPDSADEEKIYSLRGRGFVALGARTVLVPQLEYIREDRVRPNSGQNTPLRLDGELFRLGLGLNYFPDTDHFLFLGADYLDGSRDLEFYSENWTATTLRAGFETRVLSWLTTRGSLGFVAHDIDTPIESYIDPWHWLNLDDSQLRVNLGVAFHMGPADLDLAFGERYPERIFLGQPFEPQKNWLSATARWLF